MKRLVWTLLLCLLLTCACSPVGATAPLTEPTAAPTAPAAPAESAAPTAPAAPAESAAPSFPADWSEIRLTQEGHVLRLPADMTLLEGDAESAAAGLLWSASNDLLDVTYRRDADTGLTLERYAQSLCEQEGFTAESLRVGDVDCVRLTPLDTDEGFCALLWRAREGEIQQLQFAYALDTDAGYELAERVMSTLGRAAD